MKKTNRFALLAILGAIISSAALVGCGNSDDGGDEGAANNAAPAAGAKDDAGDE